MHMTKQEGIGAVIGIGVIGLGLLGGNALMGGVQDLTGEASLATASGSVQYGDMTAEQQQPEGKSTVTSSGLTYQDSVIGTGTEATAGKIVSVHYTGTLTDGKMFDSSRVRNQPFEFVLGAGQVIAGWEEGIVGMREGGTRVLIIPAALAYGDSGVGEVIPPNATLVFEVQLIDVK